MATTAEEEGVRRWLQSKDDPSTSARFKASLTKDRQIIHLLLQTRDSLKKLYADKSRTATLSGS